MSKPTVEYSFDILFPPVPGSSKRARFRGTTDSREFTYEVVKTYANELQARQREKEYAEQNASKDNG